MISGENLYVFVYTGYSVILQIVKHMDRKFLGIGVFALTSYFQFSAFAAPTSEQYTQRRVIQNVYGAAFTATGSVNDLYSNSSIARTLNKTLWLTFPPQPSNPAANEWVEIGGTKGNTSVNIAQVNPQLPGEQTYYEGHYFTY